MMHYHRQPLGGSSAMGCSNVTPPVPMGGAILLPSTGVIQHTFFMSKQSGIIADNQSGITIHHRLSAARWECRLNLAFDKVIHIVKYSLKPFTCTHINSDMIHKPLTLLFEGHFCGLLCSA